MKLYHSVADDDYRTKRENDALKKNVDKLKKDGAYYQQIWREATTDYEKLKAENDDMGKMALDAKQKLAQALPELNDARVKLSMLTNKENLDNCQ